MKIPAIDTLTSGEPFSAFGLAFFPLFLPDNPLPHIVTGEISGLTVGELDDPSVSTLKVRNPGPDPALLVEGEHLVGGDQNRSLNVSVLLKGLSELEVPVSCLEAGRWGSRRPMQRHWAFSSSRVRRRQNEGVNRTMAAGRSRRGDQHRVWGAVDELLAERKVSSDTSAAAEVGPVDLSNSEDMRSDRSDSRSEAVEAFIDQGPLPNQCGILVAEGGQVRSMDLFGAPHLLQAHWTALVRSHLMEAPDGDGTLSEPQMIDWIQRFARAEAQQEPGVGLGTEYRVRDPLLNGHALVLDDRLVHAAFFVGEQHDDFGRRSRSEDSPQNDFRTEPAICISRSPAGPSTDRSRGIMAGLAVGNLLGVSTEGRSKEVIAAQYPSGIREILAREGWPDDDDVAQALAVAAAAEQGPLGVEDLGRRLWDWAETNGLGMGSLTEAVMTMYGGARPARGLRNGLECEPREPAGVPIDEASQRSWRGGRAGNGAVLRCAPLAIRWFDDPGSLVRNSIVSAVPTHWDWRCGWSCALLNLAAAAALRGERLSADQLLDTALAGVCASLPELRRYGYESRVPDSVGVAVRRAERERLGSFRLDGRDMGYTLLTLRVGLSAYWSVGGSVMTFENGLRTVVEAGGDTDSNGAVAGAVLGACFGLSGIPARWRDRVAAIRAARIPMEDHADRLLRAAE